MLPGEFWSPADRASGYGLLAPPLLLDAGLCPARPAWGAWPCNVLLRLVSSKGSLSLMPSMDPCRGLPFLLAGLPICELAAPEVAPSCVLADCCTSPTGAAAMLLAVVWPVSRSRRSTQFFYTTAMACTHVHNLYRAQHASCMQLDQVPCACTEAQVEMNILWCHVHSP